MERNPRKTNRNLGVYRFGCIAISRGYVTLEQVQTALAEQMEACITGEPHRLLGEILRDHNLITEEQMASILEEMEVEAE